MKKILLIGAEVTDFINTLQKKFQEVGNKENK